MSATAGDRVICSTWGGSFEVPQTWQAFADHTEKIVVGEQFDPVPLIFQAAGNRLAYDYDPFPYMEIVGGTQQNDTRWVQDEIWGSPVGDFIDVMAPAAGIYSTRCNSDSHYGTSSGTSYATPQVAGLAALIWSLDPDFDREDVLDLVYRGCDPIVGYSANLHGHGRINVFNSLALASGTLWTRDPYPGEAGTNNFFKAAGAEEGATVWFYYGDGSGQTQVTVGTCTITLDIANATLIPAESAVATSNGAAIIEQAVPGSWSEETFWLQCVEEEGCRKSNVVVFDFP
ncbi:MAG: S8/S53 family peptidase [Phycisphaerales bacterium]|nr:S8/S53 family peptidase [Phycisphaerales bacterium]